MGYKLDLGKIGFMNLRAGRRVYILFQEGEVVDVWTNLKKLCTDMATDTKRQFVSYSKLSKMGKESGRLDFRGKNGKIYFIMIRVVR